MMTRTNLKRIRRPALICLLLAGGVFACGEKAADEPEVQETPRAQEQSPAADPSAPTATPEADLGETTDTPGQTSGMTEAPDGAEPVPEEGEGDDETPRHEPLI